MIFMALRPLSVRMQKATVSLELQHVALQGEDILHDLLLLPFMLNFDSGGHGRAVAQRSRWEGPILSAFMSRQNQDGMRPAGDTCVSRGPRQDSR